MADEKPESPPNPRGRRTGDRRMQMRPGPGQAMWLGFGVLLMLALGQAVFVSLRSGQTIAYSEFKDAVRSGRVQEVTVGQETVHGLLKSDDAGKAKPFTSVRIEDPKLVEELNRAQGSAQGGDCQPLGRLRCSAGSFRSSSSSRSGVFSSAGWVAPRAA